MMLILGCGLGLIQTTEAEAAGASALEQRTQSFTIRLQGSVAEVTPLFGPVREAEWAPTWRPRFICPAVGEQREGVVFTTTNAKGKTRLWLLTDYDVKRGRVEYVLVTPGFTIDQIKIQVNPDRTGQSKATITYRHSALAPEGNEEVATLDADWAEQQRFHWERAINAVLTQRGMHD